MRLAALMSDSDAPHADDSVAPHHTTVESVLVWEDELGPSTVPRGAFGKIKLLKSTVAKLQVLVGKMAVGERVCASVCV